MRTRNQVFTQRPAKQAFAGLPPDVFLAIKGPHGTLPSHLLHGRGGRCKAEVRFGNEGEVLGRRGVVGEEREFGFRTWGRPPIVLCEGM
jgi:hypothetical protein